MAQTFTDTIIETFYVVSCYTCGVRFGIDSNLYRRAVTDAKGSVYCPACQSASCWRESDASIEARRLRAEIETANRRVEMAKRRAGQQEQYRKDAENKLRAQKGVTTKLKKRVANGVCPCCNRTFANLHRHMQNKHPDYAPTVAGEV